MFSIGEIIDIAVKLEKNGETIYSATAAQTRDGPFRDLLNWMAGEESAHAERFVKIKGGIVADEEHPMPKEMRKSLVDRFVGNQAFSLNEVAFSKIKGQKELIQIMLDFEKDTILFYEMMRSFLAEEGPRSALDEIIAEEKQHVEKLSALRT